MTHARLLLVLGCAVALAGCPDNNPAADTGVDASAPPDVLIGGDTGPDAPEGDDAGSDTGVPDDTGMEGDGGMPLPAIVTPEPHTVPASADGHDRYFGVAFAPDSSFYVVGTRADGVAATDDVSSLVAHFGADGELDESFGVDGFFVTNLAVGTNGEVARGIGIQSDGSIVVAATIEHLGAADARDRDVAIFRVTPAGALDATFGVDGVRVLDLSEGEVVGTGFVADNAWGVQIDAMDRVVVSVGLKRTDFTDSDFGIVRLTEDGALDTSFAGDGIFSLDIAEASASVRGIDLLPDGLIAASGYYTLEGVVRPVVYVVDEDGVLADGFGDGGIYTEIVLAAQAEVYGIAVQGTSLVTTGYGRDDAPGDNDLISIRLTPAGERDTTYGVAGNAVLSGYDFGDNFRALTALPDGRTLHVGALRSDASTSDGAIVVLEEDGAIDTSFDTDGVRLVNTADGTVDHLWATHVDPRGERVVVVGIGGTTPATDDDGLVYLFPVP